MPKTAERSLSNRRSPHFYQVYGLCVTSHWPLSCPEGTGARLSEVELFEGPASLYAAVCNEAARGLEGEEWFRHLRSPDGSEYLRWAGLFEFLVSADGRRIAGRPLNGTSLEAFRTYLLGQVLSFALLKQGVEPLHSTAVVIDGGAVGFIGDCGYGKSSLGAAFLQAGYPLLTDDLLVIKEEGHSFVAYPGPPRIKLFPAIAKSLLGDCVEGTPMNNLTPKLIIPLERHRSHRAAAILKTIYVLTHPGAGSRCERVTIRRLSQQRAFLELLRNTFNPVIIERERLKRQFTIGTLVASKIPIKSLSYPRTLLSLPSVREAVLKDLTR